MIALWVVLFECCCIDTLFLFLVEVSFYQADDLKVGQIGTSQKYFSLNLLGTSENFTSSLCIHYTPIILF